jgi:hypothetical protein
MSIPMFNFNDSGAKRRKVGTTLGAHPLEPTFPFGTSYVLLSFSGKTVLQRRIKEQRGPLNDEFTSVNKRLASSSSVDTRCMGMEDKRRRNQDADMAVL